MSGIHRPTFVGEEESGEIGDGITWAIDPSTARKASWRDKALDLPRGAWSQQVLDCKGV